MSLRKIAGLLAAGGLTVGLIGGGVGAVFQDQVTATENINVAPFSCQIVAATPGAASDGIAADGKSLTFTAPTIMSSAPGSAPFTFTVKNTGGINAVLTITESPSLSAPWSYIALTPSASFPLAAGASQSIAAGVQWAELSQSNAGTSGSATWTVNCGEAPATHTVTSAALNYGPTGWAGWSCDTGHVVSASITDNTSPIGPVILWKPGATAGSYTYPTTPFGYTYAANEEGAIAQNGGTGQTVHIVLVCTNS
jgi:hypothetical protein